MGVMRLSLTAEAAGNCASSGGVRLDYARSVSRPGLGWEAVSAVTTRTRYRSIFTPSTRAERVANFASYLAYTEQRNGALLTDERDLAVKRQRLAFFQAHPVRSRRPLPDPARFHDNALVMRDDPRTLDRVTLLLTFLYKFARHEWLGITAAWDVLSVMAESDPTIERIGHYHLCEEFCHMRLFGEMFRTFQLDGVTWAPPGKWTGRLYRRAARLPGTLVAPPAFVSELMGLTVYRHLDRGLDDLLADEPEARARIRELLLEIMTDELAHVGQRRNFLGPVGLRVARGLVGPMYRMFFRDLPETKLLFDFRQMVEDGQTFDYRVIPAEIVARSWVPSYCRA
jgi:hypothetical protein